MVGVGCVAYPGECGAPSRSSETLPPSLRIANGNAWQAIRSHVASRERTKVSVTRFPLGSAGPGEGHRQKA
jgi:hypothetical protein